MATWSEDSKGENLAAELKIGLSVINQRYPLKRIKIGQGLRNQARADTPLDESVVADYSRVIENGGKLPAIFITADGKVWAGNHRIAAAQKKGLLTIGVYILTPPERGGGAALESFKRRDNLAHGRRVKEEERLIHCIYMAKHHNQRPSDLAKAYNMPYQKVTRAIRADGIKCLVRRNKIDVDWSMNTYDRLHSLSDEKAILAVARLGERHRMTQSEVCSMIDDVNTKRSLPAKLRVVERWDEDIHGANSSSPTPGKSRAKRQTVAEKYRDRAKKELLGPSGFRAFIFNGNKGGPFKTFKDLGVEEPGETARLSESIKNLVQALSAIRGKKK